MTVTVTIPITVAIPIVTMIAVAVSATVVSMVLVSLNALGADDLLRANLLLSPAFMLTAVSPMTRIVIIRIALPNIPRRNPHHILLRRPLPGTRHPLIARDLGVIDLIPRHP